MPYNSVKVENGVNLKAGLLRMQKLHKLKCSMYQGSVFFAFNFLSHSKALLFLFARISQPMNLIAQTESSAITCAVGYNDLDLVHMGWG